MLSICSPNSSEPLVEPNPPDIAGLQTLVVVCRWYTKTCRSGSGGLAGNTRCSERFQQLTDHPATSLTTRPIARTKCSQRHLRSGTNTNDPELLRTDRTRALAECAGGVSARPLLGGPAAAATLQRTDPGLDRCTTHEFRRAQSGVGLIDRISAPSQSEWDLRL